MVPAPPQCPGAMRSGLGWALGVAPPACCRCRWPPGGSRAPEWCHLEPLAWRCGLQGVAPLGPLFWSGPSRGPWRGRHAQESWQACPSHLGWPAGASLKDSSSWGRPTAGGGWWCSPEALGPRSRGCFPRGKVGLGCCRAPSGPEPCIGVAGREEGEAFQRKREIGRVGTLFTKRT